MGELAWAALDGRSLSERYLAVLAVWTAIAAVITWLAQTRQSKVDFG